MTDSVDPKEELLKAFGESMRHVAATVYAVTTKHEGQNFGILATAVNSLSFDPPSLLVCINRNSSLHEPLIARKEFAVNVLAQENRNVADHFMTPDVSDRFEVGDWEEENDLPVLKSAQSSFLCRLENCHEFGTHSVLIGELIGADHRNNGKPLIYLDRNYLDIS